MKKPTASKPHILILLALLFVSSGFGQGTYNQATTGTYKSGANLIEKSATASPNDLASFTTDVNAAFSAGLGGVLDFPSTIGNNTVVYRGTYASGTKRMAFSSSIGMQNATGSATAGTFYPVSGTILTTTTNNYSSYELTIGSITNVATEQEMVDEAVRRVGFTILSRADAAYPLDIQVTATFSDDSTQIVKTNVGNGRGVDDTFFGFTAPEGQSVKKIRLESFAPGTETPVANRIGFDDFGFITSETGLTPLPQIVNVLPAIHTIIDPAQGIQFEARSVSNIPPSGLSLILNSIDVSAGLIISGVSTNRFVSYGGLLSNQTYVAVMTVSNVAGVYSTTNRFYTYQTNFSLFDSGGFSDDTIYPIGFLGGFPPAPVVHGESTWLPSPESSEIVDVGGENGKVLRRMQMGNDQTDILHFPNLANGMLTISFDARVSNAGARTLDICLLPASGGLMASFLAFGTNANKLSYYDGTAWVGIADLDTDWHHLRITNYLSGVHRGKFDLSLDGILIGEKLVWRHAIPELAPLGRLRVGAIRGNFLGEYGEVDNLVIAGAPAPIVALPATLLNLTRSGNSFSFSFISQNGFNHTAEYRDSLSSGTWLPLENIVGDGLEKIVIDTNLNGSARFYRVTTQ